ncbi:MAG: hypothetical protein A2033_10665 [Bacteroidetes bacterium GWA2_31_9]|nr:MAG: hypothetical protein A2033_10665 [Bacteroidetes bacterium GWA2_31_9]
MNAQTSSESENGTVSFLSSQNIYVKFQSTKGILVGDTLFSNINNVLTPILVVKNLSSTSVVCENISSNKLMLNDKIIAKRNSDKKIIEKQKSEIENIMNEETDTLNLAKTNNSAPKQKINGRISISDYSNFSNTPEDNSNRLNYSLMLNIRNISNSNFSLDSYISFRHETGEWNYIQSNIFNGLKIYNLSVKYDLGKKSFVSIGRKINSNISNIGAIDGLQAEKSFNNFFIGGFAGSRPNYLDYSFDFKLFQAGAYFGHNFSSSKGNMQSTLSIVNQTNNLITDRRFVYFQHNNSLVKNLNVFYSLELDLYQKLNDKSQNVLNFTNTFLSLRYKIFKKITLTTTYDSRKNVIYYETYKNYINTLIETETRQGYSFRINYNVTKHLFTGVKTGYRFQKSDTRPSKNLYAFITYNNLFGKSVTSTLSSTILETSYLNGKVFNLRLSKGLMSGKMNFECGYSFVHYKILKAELPLIQHIASIGISSEIYKNLSLSVNFETDFEKPNRFYRLYLQVRKRF